jgi:hypothetical protein
MKRQPKRRRNNKAVLKPMRVKDLPWFIRWMFPDYR